MHIKRHGWSAFAALFLALACSNDFDGYSFDETGGSSSGGTSTSGGSAGASTGGTSTSGGTAGAATGGAAGTTPTGGTGGTTPTGGTGGTTPTGGTGGTLPTGGTGGTTPTGGTGGGGTATGFVTCEATNDCDVTINFCCVSASGSNPYSCKADGTQCNNGTDVHCDGPEDCPTGQVCCGHYGNGYVLSCVPTNNCGPGGGNLLVCGSTPSVCPGTTSCKPGTILTKYNFCTN